jgi:hypothetical protein
MKVLGRLATLAFTVSLAVAMGNCGGQTTGESTTSSGGSVSAGGKTGVGGSVSVGGKTSSPVVVAGAPAVHRSKALSCVGVFSPGDPPSTLTLDTASCTKHSDCTAGLNGKCAATGIGMAGGYYSCNYDECATDADCDAGMVCECSASAAARCLSNGNCRTDADCGNGPYSYCSPSSSWDCGGYRPFDGYHCHTASDTCFGDSDCTGSDYCNFDVYAGFWKCTATDKTCVIG